MEIAISNLTKRYGQQLALHDVSFKVHQGEVVGLLGPNGAGKSTLMKCLTGSLKPTHGNILINGLPIAENEMATKKLLGYLPENNPLYAEMYVQEFLAFVANIRKLPKTAVLDVIEKVGLGPEKSKKIKMLSKGYKQRVGLAQAIMHQPEILILDEPTNGLDPNQIIEIRNLIKQVGENKTIIISTHIMQEVAALCTRVVLLKDGKMLANQSIEDFKGSFNSLEEAFHQLTTK